MTTHVTITAGHCATGTRVAVWKNGHPYYLAEGQSIEADVWQSDGHILVSEAEYPPVTSCGGADVIAEFKQ
jgi:hypothetical protein